MDWQEKWSLYGAFCRFMGRIFIEIGTVGGTGLRLLRVRVRKKGERDDRARSIIVAGKTKEQKNACMGRSVGNN